MVLHHKNASTLTMVQYLMGMALIEAILSIPELHVWIL